MADQHPDDTVSLYVTVPNKGEGIRIGRILVEAKLAACANVLDGVTSVFSWEGEIQEETEAVLFAKTRSDLVANATARIVDEHSYDCPCVVALPISGGNPEFIEWISAETKS